MFLMRFDALKCVFEACVSIFYSEGLQKPTDSV